MACGSSTDHRQTPAQPLVTSQTMVVLWGVPVHKVNRSSSWPPMLPRAGAIPRPGGMFPRLRLSFHKLQAPVTAIASPVSLPANVPLHFPVFLTSPERVCSSYRHSWLAPITRLARRGGRKPFFTGENDSVCFMVSKVSFSRLVLLF